MAGNKTGFREVGWCKTDIIAAPRYIFSSLGLRDSWGDQLSWRVPQGSHHQNEKRSVRDRPPSMSKISAESVQQFPSSKLNIPHYHGEIKIECCIYVFTLVLPHDAAIHSTD